MIQEEIHLSSESEGNGSEELSSENIEKFEMNPESTLKDITPIPREPVSLACTSPVNIIPETDSVDPSNTSQQITVQHNPSISHASEEYIVTRPPICVRLRDQGTSPTPKRSFSHESTQTKPWHSHGQFTIVEGQIDYIPRDKPCQPVIPFGFTEEGSESPQPGTSGINAGIADTPRSPPSPNFSSDESVGTEYTIYHSDDEYDAVNNTLELLQTLNAMQR